LEGWFCCIGNGIMKPPRRGRLLGRREQKSGRALGLLDFLVRIWNVDITGFQGGYKT
jgi:hypothetical protein